jgi:hypothetical protein
VTGIFQMETLSVHRVVCLKYVVEVSVSCTVSWLPPLAASRSCPYHATSACVAHKMQAQLWATACGALKHAVSTTDRSFDAGMKQRLHKFALGSATEH